MSCKKTFSCDLDQQVHGNLELYNKFRCYKLLNPLGTHLKKKHVKNLFKEKSIEFFLISG